MDTEARILVLIRHAKAVSSYSEYKDFDRPLTQHGIEEAKRMANWLHEKLAALSILPHLLLTSSAQRTRETANIFSAILPFQEQKIEVDSRLYLPQKDTFYQVIEKVADSVNTLFLFSHNNGITDFANSLTNNRIDVIPPSGVVAFQCKDTSWKNIRVAAKEWLWFHSPGLPG